MYKKTLIRKFFIEYLKTNIASVNNKVYAGRIDPMNEKDKFPYLAVYTQNEQIQEGDFTSHTLREMDLLISVNIKANQTAESDFDELVENLMFEVEKYMSRLRIVPSTYIPTVSDNFLLFNNVIITDTLINNDNNSGSDIGTALMRYKIGYDYESPIVPLVLEDFDLEASLANIKILNEGVPIND